MNIGGKEIIHLSGEETEWYCMPDVIPCKVQYPNRFNALAEADELRYEPSLHLHYVMTESLFSLPSGFKHVT